MAKRAWMAPPQGAPLVAAAVPGAEREAGLFLVQAHRAIKALMAPAPSGARR